MPCGKREAELRQGWSGSAGPSLEVTWMPTRFVRAFTQFFVDRGHSAVALGGPDPAPPAAPLFTNAGMNQFIPYFLGEERPPFPRATSIQKCVRIRGKHDDIDLIGRTTRHLTFFEMLGNFSFGDYFKERAIPFAWELLTGSPRPRRRPLVGQRLPRRRRGGRDLARRGGRSRRAHPALGDDNFWEMGETGPCGPCSEIYYDRGPDWGPDGRPGWRWRRRALRRALEPGLHAVRPAARRQPGAACPKPNIDTGAGLERVLMVLQDVPSIWETDVLRPIIARAEALTGRTYGEDAEVDVALRILADHARSVSFLISDGVFPSNEDRGYVLRRLIRRAVRQAYLLGVERPGHARRWSPPWSP